MLIQLLVIRSHDAPCCTFTTPAESSTPNPISTPNCSSSFRVPTVILSPFAGHGSNWSGRVAALPPVPAQEPLDRSPGPHTAYDRSRANRFGSIPTGAAAEKCVRMWRCGTGGPPRSGGGPTPKRNGPFCFYVALSCVMCIEGLRLHMCLVGPIPLFHAEVVPCAACWCGWICR